MIVSQSNGEISATVEETNRVRAMLGLKPLKGTHPATSAAPAAPAAPAVPHAGPGAFGPSVDREALSRAPPPKQIGGKEALLGITLSRYTEARPLW